MPLEDADDVGVGEQVHHLETGRVLGFLHLHLVHVLSLGASGKNSRDALLAAQAEVALPVGRAHRDGEAARNLDRDGVDGARGEDPRGEVTGPGRGGLDLDELPRGRRQRSLARFDKGAQAAGTQGPRTGHGSPEPGGDPARRGERVSLLHPASLPLGALQTPLRLVVTQPTVKVFALVRARAEGLESLARDVHRIQGVAAADVAGDVAPVRGRRSRAREGSRGDRAGLRGGRDAAPRGRVLDAAEKTLDPRTVRLADEGARRRPGHVLHVELVAARLLTRRRGGVVFRRVGVFGGEELALGVVRAEQVGEFALLELVILLAHHLVEPVGVSDPGARVRDVLQRGGDADDLLDRARQSGLVVVPVEELPHVGDLVGVAGWGILGPIAEERSGHGGFMLEDGHRHRALRRGRPRGLLGDDVLSLETLIVGDVAADESAETLRRGRRARFPVAVLLEALGHRGRLGDVVDEIFVGEVPALAVEHVQPLVRNLAHSLVHLLQRGPLEELVKHLGLKHLDELELSAAFHLEALELLERAVEVEHGVSFLDEDAFLLGRREDHGLVRAVDFKLDGHLGGALVGPLLLVCEGLILVVCALQRGQAVEHGARVGDGELLLVHALLGLERELLGEGPREAAPDTVRVQLQGLADVVDQPLGHLNDLRACVRHHARHLHRVPARTLAHDVPVEGVEDALVRQLERVEQSHHVLRLLHRDGVAAFLRVAQLTLPRLVQALVLVPAVAEVLHGVDIEAILALTDTRHLTLGDRLVQHALVNLLAVHLKTVLLRRRLLLVREVRPVPRAPVARAVRLGGKLLSLELRLDGGIVRRRGGVVLASPEPLHLAKAGLTRPVEVTRGAHVLGDHRRGLEPVGEDDVWVHRRDVEVVDERLGHLDRVVPQVHQLLGDGGAYLVVVLDVFRRHLLTLVVQRVLEILVEGVEQALVSLGVHPELGGNVRAEDPSLEALHVSADVRLGLQQVALVVLFPGALRLVRAHDVGAIRLHHQESLAQGTRAFPQNLVGRQRDDGGQREDERVHVGHVQVVGGHRVGHRVGRHVVRLLLREREHVLRVNLHRVVSQLRLGHRFQAVGPGGKIRIALHPGEGVEVQRAPRAAFAGLPVAPKTQLEVHAHAVLLRAGLDEGPIEKVAVVRDVHGGTHLAHVIEPTTKQGGLVGLVPHDERAGVLRLGAVLEILDVGAHHLAVDDQVPLPVQHVRDHENLIVLGVWKLERQLGGLDVERADLDLAAR